MLFTLFACDLIYVYCCNKGRVFVMAAKFSKSLRAEIYNLTAAVSGLRQFHTQWKPRCKWWIQSHHSRKRHRQPSVHRSIQHVIIQNIWSTSPDFRGSFRLLVVGYIEDIASAQFPPLLL